ncbi:MAG TPA: hypothetical protein VLA31_04205 [Burkholderiaceae bacterium]|nr:hypothetical protein [Burkholderiaceae bacterium]
MSYLGAEGAGAARESVLGRSRADADLDILDEAESDKVGEVSPDGLLTPVLEVPSNPPRGRVHCRLLVADGEHVENHALTSG